ncbi:STAS domain-containing protein [candidate division FCPU426 bacterium]|nr:STAS domain-containing protein [candidate division FCPU426 bacterium]
MSGDIVIKTSTHGSVEVVKVSGFMDMTQVEIFEQMLDTLISSGKMKIVLDFSDLEYIASSALGAIIARIHTTRLQKGDIRIGGHSPVVLDILQSFGFSRVFSLASTPEEAIALFKT